MLGANIDSANGSGNPKNRIPFYDLAIDEVAEESGSEGSGVEADAEAGLPAEEQRESGRPKPASSRDKQAAGMATTSTGQPVTATGKPASESRGRYNSL